MLEVGQEAGDRCEYEVDQDELDEIFCLQGMAGINECINTNGDLHDFFIENDLIDAVSILNPSKKQDPIFLHETQNRLYTHITYNGGAGS